MYVLLLLCVAPVVIACKNRTTNSAQSLENSLSPKISQLPQQGGKSDEKGLMSLLFHGPVASRLVDIGLEDSNKALKKEIELNETENHIETLLNRLQESEQNQLDAVQESFYLQNEQLDQIKRFVDN